jgi:nucleotide-binding universal stress UspA family protein
MIRRILVAVDDSAPALAAARFAIELAQRLSAELGVVTIAEPGHDPGAILRHVADLAQAAGVSPTVTAIRDGDLPFESVLDEARAWNSDLVVMGRSDKRPTGRPYVGSQTEHLLEFTDVPVVVVPGNGARRPRP